MAGANAVSVPGRNWSETSVRAAARVRVQGLGEGLALVLPMLPSETSSTVGVPKPSLSATVRIHTQWVVLSVVVGIHPDGASLAKTP